MEAKFCFEQMRSQEEVNEDQGKSILESRHMKEVRKDHREVEASHLSWGLMSRGWPSVMTRHTEGPGRLTR